VDGATAVEFSSQDIAQSPPRETAHAGHSAAKQLGTSQAVGAQHAVVLGFVVVEIAVAHRRWEVGHHRLWHETVEGRQRPVQVDRPVAPAHVEARLAVEEDHIEACLLEAVGCHEAGKARADDGHLGHLDFCLVLGSWWMRK